MLVKRADWAVLIYSSGSRDLESAARAALAEVAQADLADRVVVGAQLGTAGETLRLSLPEGQAESLPPVDMAEPATLKDFLRWGMQRFPARHYAVVLGGHSGGFLGAVTDAERRKMMRLPALAAALGELKPDLVVFNSCLMAQAEVAAELAPTARFLVASQTEEKGLGMPLGEWLTTLQGSPDQAARELAQACERSGERAPRVSAVDLRPTTDWLQGLDRLAEQVLREPAAAGLLRAHIQSQESLWPRPLDRPLSELKDLSELVGRWEGDQRLSPELRHACRAVLDTVPDGLSIYAPAEPAFPRVTEIYEPLELARSTRWDEAMRALVG